MGDVRLFVSHAHKDGEIAAGMVDLIETALVRNGRILCTSHPDQREYGYPNSNRIDVSDHLREHLSESSCVVAILTPYSLESRWCLFELGGAWARATKTYSLVAGGVTPAHLPAALAGRPFGKLDDEQDLLHLLLTLSRGLGWQPRNMPPPYDQNHTPEPAAARRPAFTINHLARLGQATRWPAPAPVEPDVVYRAGRQGEERAHVNLRTWVVPAACTLFGAAFAYLFIKPTNISDTSPSR